jgi:hypothetical protein
MIFDIVTGYNKGRSYNVSCQELVNFIPQNESPDSKFIKSLIGTPGYSSLVDIGLTGGCRALYTTSAGDRMFAIVEDWIYEITSGGLAVARSQVLLSSTGTCSVCDNGAQILIVDGDAGYIYTLATNVAEQITADGFPSNPSHCIFTDGYFVVNDSITGQFFFSASYDGTDWDALDYATAEYSSDRLVALAKTSNGTIWMIGKGSLELWQATGVADLPWQRIQGGVKEFGCAAPYSVAATGEYVFWLGNGLNGYGAVFAGAGYESKRISTPAIEYQIKQLSNIESATAFAYCDEGHVYYVISFANDTTFAYDMSTGLWHQRASYDSDSGTNIRQFVSNCTFFNRKLFVGSYNSTVIYEMSLDYLDEDGDPIVRKIITGNICSENRMLRHNYLELDLEHAASDPDDEAMVRMRFSDDGGKTWSDETIRYAGAGETGDYGARTIFRRLGCSRNRVYEFTMDAPSRWSINCAWIGAE